jgi:hypothetical protein
MDCDPRAPVVIQKNLYTTYSANTFRGPFGPSSSLRFVERFRRRSRKFCHLMGSIKGKSSQIRPLSLPPLIDFNGGAF